MVRRLRGVFEGGVVGVRDDRVGSGGRRCEEGEVGVRCQPAFGGEVEEADVVEDTEIVCAGGVCSLNGSIVSNHELRIAPQSRHNRERRCGEISGPLANECPLAMLGMQPVRLSLAPGHAASPIKPIQHDQHAAQLHSAHGPALGS